MLDIKEIEKIIPQRAPFLMIDKVEEYVPGESAIAYKNVNINELIIDINPLKENIISPTTTTPIITNKSQTILEKTILASNILLL